MSIGCYSNEGISVLIKIISSQVNSLVHCDAKIDNVMRKVMKDHLAMR